MRALEYLRTAAILVLFGYMLFGAAIISAVISMHFGGDKFTQGVVFSATLFGLPTLLFRLVPDDGRRA